MSWGKFIGTVGLFGAYFLFLTNLFLFKISHFIKNRNNTTTFISKFGISLGFNQLLDISSFYV